MDVPRTLSDRLDSREKGSWGLVDQSGIRGLEPRALGRLLSCMLLLAKQVIVITGGGGLSGRMSKGLHGLLAESPQTVVDGVGLAWTDGGNWHL